MIPKEFENKDISLDSLFEGQLTCHQYKQGYRFSIDAVLLAHFLQINKDATVLDIGCGCGIIGLLLCYRYHLSLHSVRGLEIQKELAQIAAHNAEVNGFKKIMGITCGDLKKISSFFEPESFSDVVCNPPFYSDSSGRKSQNSQERIARHQVSATIGDIVAASSYAVKNRGKVTLIYPALCLTELISTMRAARLEPKRLQLVYSYPSQTQKATLMLVEARKNGGKELSVLSPFYIYEGKNGKYTAEMERFYQPNNY